MALSRRSPIRYDPPLVFVHSLVSRSYILDLRPGSSMVEYFLGQGFDVFMLDWGVPDERDAENTLETYVDEYLPRAVGRQRCDESQRRGHAGGLLPRRDVRDPLCGGHADARVRNLVLMASPADYERDGRRWSRRCARGGWTSRSSSTRRGTSPADALYSGFYMQAPTKTDRPVRDAAREPLERQLRRGLPGDGAVVARPRPVSGCGAPPDRRQLVRRNALMSRARSASAGGRSSSSTCPRRRPRTPWRSRTTSCRPAAVEPLVDVVGDPARREELRLRGGHVTFAHRPPGVRAHLAARSRTGSHAHSDELDPPRER